MAWPVHLPCDNWQTFTSFLRLDSTIVLGSTEIDNFKPSTFLSSKWYLKETEEEKCPADSGIQTRVLKKTRYLYHRFPSLTLPPVFLAKMTLTATTLHPSVCLLLKKRVIKISTCLPTPEKTIFLGSAPIFKTRSSSPPETMSKPDPASLRTFRIPSTKSCFECNVEIIDRRHFVLDQRVL